MPPEVQTEENNNASQFEINNNNGGQTDDQTQETQTPAYKMAGGEFKTAEELAEYTRQLEEKVVKGQLKQEVTVPQKTLNDQLNSGDDSSLSNEEVDELFNNPTGFLTKFKKSVLDEVQKKNNQEREMKKFWDDFYQKNPHLQKQQRVVNLIVNEKYAEFAKLPVEEAKKRLAEESDLMIKNIKGEETIDKKLSNSPTVTTSPLSGDGKSQGGTQKGGEKKSFSEQVREMQRSRS